MKMSTNANENGACSWTKYYCSLLNVKAGNRVIESVDEDGRAALIGSVINGICGDAAGLAKNANNADVLH